MPQHNIVACSFKRTKDSDVEYGTAFLREPGLYDLLLIVDAEGKPVEWDSEGCVYRYWLHFHHCSIIVQLY